MRIVKVRGKYVSTPGILTYTGESTTVVVPVSATEEDLAKAAARQIETDEAAAKRASENFFFRRYYEQLDFTVEEVEDIDTSLHSTGDFEDLVVDEPEDDDD